MPTVKMLLTVCSSIKGIKARDLLEFVLGWLLEQTREGIRSHCEKSRGRGPKYDSRPYLDLVHERDGYMLLCWGWYAIDSQPEFWQGFGEPRLSLHGDVRMRFLSSFFPVAIVLRPLAQFDNEIIPRSFTRY